ncbi:MAG TPA: peroxiredoxin [Povalibacter sp.]|jgi:peroxiredoxin Q/BCP|nr:peroxiredoxin [Povalibacter sp.]
MTSALVAMRSALFGLLLTTGLAAQADVQLGSTAPEFRLQDQDGKWHRLEDYRGKWVVLYFYAKDQTPGCTTEAREFRDNIEAFRKLGTVVLGVSIDDVESHQKFAAKNSLPFPILADPEKTTVKKYDVLSFVGFARRETFLIDPQGRVVNRYMDVEPKTHPQEVLEDLKQKIKSTD